MRTRVKICGITRKDDAMAAVGLGADAIGFIFYSGSPRYIAPAMAQEIINELPSFVTPVGVFVNAQPETIHRAVDASGIRCVQLHGDELPALIGQMRVPIIKAFRTDEAFSLSMLDGWSTVDILLDASSPGSYGGTGKLAHWGVAADLAITRRVILSGGLSPENIGKAMETVHPYAVDVNSGVESAPGKKDHGLMERLFRVIEDADYP